MDTDDDRSGDDPKWQCGEQLLQQPPARSTVGSHLMIEMRGQDASSVGEMLPLRGDLSDVRDVAETADDVDGKRRGAERARSGRRPGCG